MLLKNNLLHHCEDSSRSYRQLISSTLVESITNSRCKRLNHSDNDKLILIINFISVVLKFYLQGGIPNLLSQRQILIGNNAEPLNISVVK